MESEKLLTEGEEKGETLDLDRTLMDEIRARTESSVLVVVEMTRSVHAHYITPLVNRKRINHRVIYGTLILLCGALLLYLNHPHLTTSTRGQVVYPPSHAVELDEHTSPLTSVEPIAGEISPQNVISPSAKALSLQQSTDSKPAPPKPRAPWLIVVSSHVHEVQRRMLIRNTYISLFTKDNPDLFEVVFLLGHPKREWRDVIERETATHGDIHILEQLEATNYNANTRKMNDYFVDLLQTADPSSPSYRGEPPKFVSKVDTQSYIYITRFYNEFIHPFLHADEQPAPAAKPAAINSTTASTNTTTLPPQPPSPPPPAEAEPNLVAHPHTLIARAGSPTRPDIPHRFPQSAFYTLTWPLVSALAQRHRENPIFGEREDVLIGRYLHEEDVEYEFIDLGVQGRQVRIGDEGGDVTAAMIREGRVLCGEGLGEDAQLVALADLYETVGDLSVGESAVEGGGGGRERFEEGAAGAGAGDAVTKPVKTAYKSFEYDMKAMDAETPLIELVNPKGTTWKERAWVDSWAMELTRWRARPES
ncbi:uncharacterized protein KY384_008791 [Bacidia gigantensis]|uniref:uncharacterized protein n=1 Tax=Bacidia gigantensis TaxID=2732470 RepID=UPI001D0374F9|nr:uncharacterized protein KY384_008791 [Bacidia gigantensis]KAG8526590.1 hypothetical protein KY384_008791 [Bacidia gigantensis]